MGRYFRISLFLLALGIALTAFAVTDEIVRIAERADKLYVERRYNEAFPLMKQAAEGGDLISMFNLATMYYEGQGTAQNISQARYWWQQAANRGDNLAKEMLNRLDMQQSRVTVVKNGDKTIYTVNGVSFTMVTVEGGTFTMGATPEQGSDASIDEKPAQQVTLSSFSIGQTEVTQALWQAVMGRNPSNFTGDLQRPVEKVSWNACQDFISKLNRLTGKTFRLPTEAEWEYAARGGNRSKGYKYSGSNTIGDVAWYTSNSNSQTHTVATKAANELGLYDMSGNVWEWCQDWYGSYSGEAQTDPKGSMYGLSRVYRGGSLYGNVRGCRVSYRYGYTPSNTFNDIGLRLAL